MTQTYWRAGTALCALTTLVVGTPLLAQDRAKDGEENLLETVTSDADEADTTITVTGFATQLDNTGHAVTVVDREEIEDVQGPDLTRVLARVPGIAISRNGPLGAFTGVRLRGGESEQLLVLIDGVRVSDPAAPSGGFDFGTVTSGTVGKIDVLRGSNSTIWGSDAVAGVVDISTRAERGLAGHVEYGARDTFSAGATAGVSGDEGFAGIGASYVRSDGFSAASNGMEADGFEQIAVTGSAFYDVTTAIELFAQGRYARSDVEFDGFPAPSFVLADTLDEQETTQLSGALGANYYGQDLTLRAFVSLADTSRDNTDPLVGPTFTSDGESRLVSLRGEYRLIGGLTLAFGGSSEWTEYRTLFDDGDDANITGGYVQAGWVLGNLAARAGIRIDDHSEFGSATSLGGDLSYGFAGGWRVRASIGEGFKAPSLFQLYSDFGNLALEPETSTSFDLGIEREAFDDRFRFAVTGWRRTSENLIGFDGATFTYANTARARAQGIEIEAAARPGDALEFGAVYTLTDAENRDNGAQLARRPRHAATVWGDWRTPFGPVVGADIRLVGDSFDDAANRVRLDGYSVVDLRASLPLGERLELFGRLENVFDAQYQTAFGYATAGRGAFVGIRTGR